MDELYERSWTAYARHVKGSTADSTLEVALLIALFVLLAVAFTSVW